MMRARSVILDFGGVIAFFDLVKAYTRLAMMSERGLNAREVGNSIEDLRDVYERGGIPSVEFLAALQSRLQLTATASQIATAWCEIFTPNPAVLDLIPRLRRASYRLVLGSNTNELHYEHFSRQFASALDLFDTRVLSYELRIKKPDPRFYSECVAAARCAAAECVYVDDIETFVAAAQELGIAGVAYDPAVDLVKAFQLVGVAVE